MGLFNIFGSKNYGSTSYSGTAENQYKQLKRNYYNGNVTAKEAMIKIYDLTEYKYALTKRGTIYTDLNLQPLQIAARQVGFGNDNYAYVINHANPYLVKENLETLFKDLRSEQIKYN